MDIMTTVSLQGSIRETLEAADRMSLHNLVIEVKQLSDRNQNIDIK
jgi:hypothetical protein